jgi:hypothetical protein
MGVLLRTTLSRDTRTSAAVGAISCSSETEFSVLSFNSFRRWRKSASWCSVDHAAFSFQTSTMAHLCCNLIRSVVGYLICIRFVVSWEITVNYTHAGCRLWFHWSVWWLLNHQSLNVEWNEIIDQLIEFIWNRFWKRVPHLSFLCCDYFDVDFFCRFFPYTDPD